MTFSVGDRVTVGAGKTVWIIDHFWEGNDGTVMASLTKEGSNGYVNSSAEPSRLRADE